MFKPDPNIHKYQISTPCYFVGHYENDYIALELAQPSVDESFTTWDSIHNTAYARNYIIIVFKSIDKYKKDDVDSYLYSFARRISILLSVYYGKCINEHGFLEFNGGYWIPTSINTVPNKYNFIAPFNQIPRKDLGDIMNSPGSNRPCLDGVKRIAPIFDTILDETEFNNILLTAGSFYLHSLQSFNNDPEIAYLDLISCGEVLSNFKGFNYDDDKLLPEDLLNDFNKLEIECKEIIDIAKLKKNFRSIKRRFTLTLLKLVNNYYFNNIANDLGSSSFFNYHYNKIILKDNAKINIKYSYDIRSKYLHAGKSFGKYIIPFRNSITEIRVGEIPDDIGDSDFRKALNNALLYVGLERIMRFCLLRFIHKFSGIEIDERLNDD